MERLESANDDGTVWKECLICHEMRTGVHTTYAHKKAKEEAASFAHKGALEKTEDTAIDDFIDYYMMLYRKIYTSVYEELFNTYRNEYETLLHRKYQNFEDEDDICSYHHDSIEWLTS